MYFFNSEPELFGMLMQLFLAYLEPPQNLLSLLAHATTHLRLPIFCSCLHVTVWGYKRRHKQGREAAHKMRRPSVLTSSFPVFSPG